ncbi:hypothetical protein TDB9533_03241 [Thalassocella blandensis]|nr:hypothetical protein TDB9533_03241 [Thalassocella blandensis]
MTLQGILYFHVYVFNRLPSAIFFTEIKQNFSLQVLRMSFYVDEFMSGVKRLHVKFYIPIFMNLFPNAIKKRPEQEVLSGQVIYFLGEIHMKLV